MIEVSVQKDSITISGHAGYAPAGQDIVCAGVTAVLQTLIESIKGLTRDSPKYVAGPGICKIELKDLSEESKLLVDSFFIGLCRIAEGFPDHVRIA